MAALLPLAVLVLLPAFYVRACLVLLPLLAVTGVGLLESTRRETDPLTLLERLCSERKVEQYLTSLVPQIDAKIAETKALELTRAEDRPTHEWGWHLPIPTEQDDPLNCLATLGLLAIRQGDLHAFARVVKRSLEVLDLAESFKPKGTTAGEYEIRAQLRSHVFEVLERLVLALQRDKGTASLTRVAVDVLAEAVAAKARIQKQTEDFVFSALRLMETLARHSYECGSRAELRVPLIVSRQVVQKGMDVPLRVDGAEQQPIEVSMFNHQLPHLSNTIKGLGSFAVGKGDSEFLYRCFDAFGWLGCSAVKHGNVQVGTACLRALSQLGREARAKELECFWDKCAVRPEDHAAERIDWIASWLCKIPEERREYWVELLEAAYSRFYGKETTLTFETAEDGKSSIKKTVSQKNHVEGYILRAGSRDVDYSDFTFLKDLELHGGRGVVMEGPLMPLTATNGS